MLDLFLGKKNDKIIKKAKKLGFKEIFFCKLIEDIEEIDKDDKNKFDAYIIKTEKIEKLRRIIDKASNFLKIIVIGTNNEINRSVLESKKVFILLDPHYKREKDFLDCRNSGLNHILCKIAKENQKIIFVSFSSLLDYVSLGRVIQNFKLCKKYNLKIQLINFCDENSLDKIKKAHELKEIERILVNKKHFEYKKIQLFR